MTLLRHSTCCMLSRIDPRSACEVHGWLYSSSRPSGSFSPGPRRHRIAKLGPGHRHGHRSCSTAGKGIGRCSPIRGYRGIPLTAQNISPLSPYESKTYLSFVSNLRERFETNDAASFGVHHRAPNHPKRVVTKGNPRQNASLRVRWPKLLLRKGHAFHSIDRMPVDQCSAVPSETLDQRTDRQACLTRNQGG
jgi:hypothetical protein